MTFRTSTSRICMRALGAMLAVVFFTAAPISPSKFASTQAQAQASVSVEFRTALEPYGRWQRHARWGEVWIPADRGRDWRPYTVGRWVYTEDWGWYWVEDQEEANWGWVTFHYGRWIFDRGLGWAWVPSNEWGPGFVQWRHGKERVGWAPLPPEEIIVEYREQPEVWIFVRIRDFVAAPRLVGVILPPREYPVYLRETVVVNQTVVLSDRRIAVNPGVPAALVAAAVGRPLRAYEVRPRILAGTVQVPGAIEVRAQDVRDRSFRGQVTVRETQNVVRPADRVQPPQPLAAGEKGRLGDNPPRAARGQTPAPTTGQGPQQQQQPQQGPLQQPRQQQGRDAQEPRPPQTQGRGGEEKQQQGPQQQQRGQQQQRQPQGKEAQEPRGPQTQGRSGEEKQQQGPQQQPGGQQQRQQPGTEGRGAQPQGKPQGTEGRGGAPQQRLQQGTDGRGGAQPGRGGGQPER